MEAALNRCSHSRAGVTLWSLLTTLGREAINVATIATNFDTDFAYDMI